MPITNPVIIMATARYFSPNAFMRPCAICCAAPVSATSLPSMAPPIITMTSWPNISPTPFSSTLPIFAGSTPRSKPAVIDVIRNARNALTLSHVISRISKTMQRMTMTMDIPLTSEFVGDLNDAHHDLMRIAIGINQAELHHGIVAVDIALDVDNLTALHVLLNIFLKNDQCIGEVDFERAWIICFCFH